MRDTVKSRVEVKADIFDRLVTLGWAVLDGDTLRLNSDTDLDPREKKMVTDLMNGTEPAKWTKRCPLCLK